MNFPSFLFYSLAMLKELAWKSVLNYNGSFCIKNARAVVAARSKDWRKCKFPKTMHLSIEPKMQITG